MPQTCAWVHGFYQPPIKQFYLYGGFSMFLYLPASQSKSTRKPNSVELLGYAQNEIVQTIQVVRTLPPEQKEKLCTAYYLLKEVQEYLYHDPRAV